MPSISCHVPITIQVGSACGEEDIRQLAAELQTAVASRVAFARKELVARGGVIPVSIEVAEPFDVHRYEPADGFYRVPYYEDPAVIAAIPITPAKIDLTPEALASQAALARIHDLLSTGLLDWWVSAKEARESLRILSTLKPYALLETVLNMELSGDWQTLLNALASEDRPRLVAFRQLIDPDTGYLMPGDEFMIRTFAGLETSPETDLSGTYTVELGAVPLPLLPAGVSFVGLQPQDAAKLVVQAYDRFLRQPRVLLSVVTRGSRYGQRAGRTNQVWWEAGLATPPSLEEVRRRDKQSEFLAYIKPVVDRDPITVQALLWYLAWLQDHQNDPDFLVKKPTDLWSESLRRATEPPTQTAVDPYLALLRSMSALADASPSDERQRLRAAISSYLSWLDQHQSRGDLAKYEPMQIFQLAYRRAIDAEMRALEERIRKEVTAEGDARRAEAHWRAAEKKFDEAFRLMMTQVWRLPEPRTVEAPSIGTGYLIMPSEQERRARDLIASEFLQDLFSRMADRTFGDTSAVADFGAWLRSHPKELYVFGWAQAHPYTERYAVDYPTYYTVVEVVVGFIPIVGSGVALYEAISGTDLFGRPLNGLERGVLAAAVLLPAAAKIFKLGRAAVVTADVARAYRLSSAEAETLFRVTANIAPATAGEKLLSRAAADVNAGRDISAQKAELDALMKEMGLTDRSTLATLEAAGTTGQRAEARLATVLSGQLLDEAVALARSDAAADAVMQRLLRTTHGDVLANLFERSSASTVRGQLQQIAQLSDRQLNALAYIKRLEADLGRDIGGQWYEVLDLPSSFRNPLLDLAEDVRGSVTAGFDGAIKRALTGGGSDIQGSLGQFFAARDLLREFPGASLEFEAKIPGREIDIRVMSAGHQIDVEVKTYLTPSAELDQIEKDLVRHVGDQWQDLLYRYAPSAGGLHSVQEAMVRTLQRPSVRTALQAAGLTPAQAESLLRARFVGPPPLVAAYAY